MPQQVRILVAESHSLLRQGVRHLLTATPQFVVVAEAYDGPQALHLCTTLRPDILLLNPSLKAASVTHLMGEIQRRCPSVRVIVLTAVNDDAYTIGFLAAGARGVVLSDEAATTLADAIHTVMAGRPWFSSVIVERFNPLAPGLGARLTLWPPVE